MKTGRATKVPQRKQPILLFILVFIIIAQVIGFVSHNQSEERHRNRSWRVASDHCRKSMMLIHEHGMELKNLHSQDYIPRLRQELQNPTVLTESICKCPINKQPYIVEAAGENDFIITTSEITHKDQAGRFTLSHGTIFSWQDSDGYQQ